MARAVIEEFRRLEQALADVLYTHSRKVDQMATVQEIQTSFDAYRAAVNQRVSDLEAAAAPNDTSALEADIAAALAEVTPPAPFDPNAPQP